MEKLIMGIDPGTNFMGYAILKTTGKNCKPELVVSGVVDMKKMSDPYLKLQRVFQRTLQVIDSYHPDELAIESQFYGKNIQSMLKLGRAQGVAIAAALQRNIPIFEYAPKKIKMSIATINFFTAFIYNTPNNIDKPSSNTNAAPNKSAVSPTALLMLFGSVPTHFPVCPLT